MNKSLLHIWRYNHNNLWHISTYTRNIPRKTQYNNHTIYPYTLHNWPYSNTKHHNTDSILLLVRMRLVLELVIADP